MNIIVGIIWLFILYLTVSEIINLVKSIQARKWRKTSGKLTKWNFNIDADSEDTRIDIREFEYVYQIGSTEYKSNKIGYGFPAWMSVLYIEKALDKILENSPQLTVFYSHKNPAISVLTAGFGMYHLVKISVLIFVLIFVTMAYTEILN